MFHPNIVLIPALCAMLWALYVKVRQRMVVDIIILVVCAIALMVNAHLVYDSLDGVLSVTQHLVQMVAAAVVLPLTYLYFSRKIKGMPPIRSANVTLWALVALIFVPQLIVCNPFEPFVVPETGLKPFACYILWHGQKLVAVYTGDLVVILQGVVLLYRMVDFMAVIYQYRLHLNRGVYVMCGFWLFTLILAIAFSSMNYEELRSLMGGMFYFCGYSLVLTGFNILIALGYDTYQLETEQGEVVENLDIYVQHQYSEMAGRMRQLMEEQRLYTDSQLTAERVIEMLGTNHTYFSQMMVAEWGMSFSDYLGNLRLAHVESLLSDPQLTISSVAMQCGFADAGYMSKKFKAKYGMTPTEWRRSQQEV